MRENKIETKKALEEFQNENYIETDMDKIIRERREKREEDAQDRFIVSYDMEDTPY